VATQTEGASGTRIFAPEVAAYGLAKLTQSRTAPGGATKSEATKEKAQIEATNRLLDTQDPLQGDNAALRLGALSLAERSASLVAYEAVIREGVLRGLSGPHPEAAIALLGSLKLAPFAIEDEAAAAAAARLRKAAEPGLAELALRGNVKDRGLALLAMSRKPGVETSRALTAGMLSTDVELARTSLGLVHVDHLQADGAETQALMAAIVRAGTTSKQWPLRHAAALSLASAHKTRFEKDARDALANMAEHDPFWIVQEAALEGLSILDLARAQSVAKQLREAAPADAARLRKVCDRIAAGRPSEGRPFEGQVK
jgi:hypothetical protein